MRLLIFPAVLPLCPRCCRIRRLRMPTSRPKPRCGHYSVQGSADDSSGHVDVEQNEVDGRTEPYLALRYRQNQRSWWPDLALQYSRIEAEGLHRVSEPTAIGGPVLVPGVTAETRADVDDVTLGVEYPLLDTLLDLPLSLSAGVAVRYLGGSIPIRDSDAGSEDAQALGEVFPLLTAALRWSLWQPLALVADGAWIQAGSSTAYPFYAGLEITPFRDFYVQAG
jgi:hypothetical protein